MLLPHVIDNKINEIFNYSFYFISFQYLFIFFYFNRDVAFAVARFVQLGGTLVNYYMWHGGTNFGRYIFLNKSPTSKWQRGIRHFLMRETLSGLTH